MARIQPVSAAETSSSVQQAFDEHVKKHKGRITHMKATLAHCLPAFDVYMQWYILYEEVKKILGERLAPLFAWSISHTSDCPLCSTYFRKILADKGENPETLQLPAQEQEVLAFGSAIAQNKGHIDDRTYQPLAGRFTKKEMVLLVAFAGQMIATNIFNNVIETDIDDYLFDYLPKPGTPT